MTQTKLIVEIVDAYRTFWWVAKNSQDAAGKEFDSIEEANKDLVLRFPTREIKYVK